MNKHIRLFMSLFLIFAGSIALQAQMFDPVKWTFEVKQEKGSNKADLILKASIEEHWHLYSQHLGDDGPIPTSFVFNPSDDYKLIGETEETTKPTLEYDPNFEMDLLYFSHEAIFTQKVELITKGKIVISGELEFMVCDETQCLPPKYIDFSFKLDNVASEKKAVVEPVKEEAVEIVEEEKTQELPSYGSEEESVDQEEEEQIAESGEDVVEGQEVVAEEVLFKDKKKEEVKRGMWAIFALGFGGGLIALLMPCIFPMIPLTVSFFTKQSKTKAEGIRKAAIYGISIVVIYVILGMMVTLLTGDSSALNQLSTNPYFNIGFFVLFVVFAMSFFGAFEITLPSSWVNKADEASNKGGLMGIFFMAFTLSLVSFSCTGPIIGSLLVDAASKGEYFGPAVGMLGFSLALAIPFALFAAFPGWMNSLPKSGGWLNTVKVSLGFIELAFAFKFLSTADMAWQAGFLKRELFLAIWIGIFLMLTLYLLGNFRMPLDSKVEKISVSRLMFAIVFGSFTLYLLPGLWGAPLHLISGFPPPQFYSEMPQGFSSGGSTISADIPEGADPEHCPHSLNCFHDFEEGLAYAKEVNKPVMLDFTGWGCVNCRKMEEQVWSDPRVLKRLREEVVLVSLYVDERIKLPEDEQYYSEVLQSKVKTIGNKWSEFQAMHYETNSQPYYVIIGHESLEPLLPPTAYDPDIEFFINWLDKGVELYEAQ
jgi:thiol:disulfide interchange protein DsbD